MGVIVALLVAFTLKEELQIVKGQGPIGGEGGNDCCLFITVNVGGDNTNLNGEYNLKENKGSKPEDVCVNSCVYTKEGSPATTEYCFKEDNIDSADAIVSCPVGISIFITFL